MNGRGVNVMRKPGTDQHYGNPFTHLKKRTAAVPVKSLDEACKVIVIGYGKAKM